jgi:hypothetical protein
VKPGLLFAGGEHAVYVSFDEGNRWHSLQLNMPDTQISDLQVTDKDLVAGTHGRSIYVLDDIAPLREYSAEIASSKFHLFQPLYAVRRVQDTSIQYYLAEEADEVRIAIVDSEGNTIVEKTGTEPEPEEVDDPYARWYGALPIDPTTAKGLNVWSWNNRYAGAADFEGMIIWSGRPQLGPIAPPGEYTVTMTVGDDTQTRTFMLKADPRFDVPEEHIHEQFRFTVQIRDAIDAANRAVIRIRDLKGAGRRSSRGFALRFPAAGHRCICAAALRRGRSPVPGKECEPPGSPQLSHPVEQSSRLSPEKCRERGRAADKGPARCLRPAQGRAGRAARAAGGGNS